MDEDESIKLSALTGAENHAVLMNALSGTDWLMTESAMEQMVSVIQLHGRDKALLASADSKLENTRETLIRGNTAIVPVRGPIFRRANLMTTFCGATALSEIVHDFTVARQDYSIKRVVLEMDTPGGQVTGISDFASLIRTARSEGLEVICYNEGLCCSAGYWIGSACDKIVTSSTGTAGSIGAMAVYKKQDADENAISFVSSQSPMKNPDITKDAGRAAMQERIDALAEAFITDVANNRGVTVDKVKSDFGKGGVFVGQAAVDAGLVDAVGTLEDILTSEQSQQTNGLFGGSSMDDDNKTVASFTQAEVDAKVEAAVATERGRAGELVQLCSKHNATDEVLANAINSGMQSGECAMAILEGGQKVVAPVATVVTEDVKKGDDNVISAMVEDSAKANDVTSDGANTEDKTEAQAQAEAGTNLYASLLAEGK